MTEDNRKQGNDPDKPQKQDSSSSAKEKQSDASLASRIQTSASQLARNAFYTPGPPQDIACSLPGGGKAAPSSSASFERSSQAVADQYRQSSASANAREQSGGFSSETFRSSSTFQQDQFDLPPFTEEEFQRTYDDGAYDSTEIEKDSGKGKGKARGTESELNAASDDQIAPDFDTVWRKSSHETSSISATQQTQSDGAAVVSLLSEPTFDPEFPPSAEEPFEPVDTELSQPTLTPEEIRAIELFRRHLPLEQSHSSRVNQSSLIPDIGSFLDSIPAASENDATALRDDVLARLPGAADWLAVEERYHDEVWGYLGPALEAAAKEMDEKNDAQKTEDGPALQRLKLILKHMQG